METSREFEFQYIDLLKACSRGDVGVVKKLLTQDPQLALPLRGWSDSPLQKALDHLGLVQQGFSSGNTLDAQECVWLLLNTGAPLKRGAQFSECPLEQVIKKGQVDTLKYLHEKEFLGDALEGNHALMVACNPGHWTNFSGKYPLHDILSVLIDAGAMAHEEDPYDEHESSSAASYLLSTCSLDTVRCKPESAERALMLLLSHTPLEAVSPVHVIQAFNARMPNAFSYLWSAINDPQGLEERFTSKRSGPRKEEDIHRWHEWVAQANAYALNTKTPESKPSSRIRF